jgi:hypothetical protein
MAGLVHVYPQHAESVLGLACGLTAFGLEHPEKRVTAVAHCRGAECLVSLACHDICARSRAVAVIG